MRLLREGFPVARGFLDRAKPLPEIKVPAGAQYVTRSFSCAAGMRSYKLYIPTTRPRGLVVMLHGCNQSPDDFAIGTAMNDVAESNGLLVAYPHQAKTNNPSSCWNWFRPADQMRGQGEPAVLAGIARELASEFRLRREQTFVAGLSAGGAMAMVMAETYPDVFGAVGVHSGLDYNPQATLPLPLRPCAGRLRRRVLRPSAASQLFERLSSMAPWTDRAPLECRAHLPIAFTPGMPSRRPARAWIHPDRHLVRQRRR